MEKDRELELIESSARPLPPPFPISNAGIHRAFHAIDDRSFNLVPFRVPA